MGTWNSITRPTEVLVKLISLGWLPTCERGTLIINPRVQETRQPWFVAHLREGNSELGPVVRGIFWHCPSLLDCGS